MTSAVLVSCEESGEAQERCYPCALHAHPCILSDPWSPSRCLLPRPTPYAILSVPQVEMSWYEVALWRFCEQFAPEIAYVQAARPFEAIAYMMRAYGYRSVLKAAAGLHAFRVDHCTCFEGTVLYRVYGLHLSGEQVHTQQQQALEDWCPLAMEETP